VAVDGGKRPLISVVIPNWNGASFLPLCLDSLKSQSFKDFEVIVVDNGSTDNSRKLLASEYKWVRVVSLEKNEGFAGGCNRGISASCGGWVVLLNNDTEAHKDWLKNIAVAIKDKPEYSFFATKILMFDKRDILDGTGDFISRSLFVFRFGQFDTDLGQYDDLGEIFSPCGASAVYKREMLDDIGLLDEDFFAYLEDIELGMRAHIAGYKGFFLPYPVIYHIGGASTDSERMSPWVYKQNIRNMFLILFKDVPFPVFLQCIPSMIFWHSAHLFYVIRRRRELFKYYFIALYESLKLYRKMKLKRRSILRNKVISNSDLYRLLKRGSRLNWVQYKIRKRYFTSAGRVSH
jgi:GT2 family glycosyltransferase